MADVEIRGAVIGDAERRRASLLRAVRIFSNRLPLRQTGMSMTRTQTKRARFPRRSAPHRRSPMKAPLALRAAASGRFVMRA